MELLTRLTAFVVLFLLVIAPSASNGDEESNDINALKDEIKMLTRRVRELEKSKKTYQKVKFFPFKDQKRILVTGGAGFVGSHLIDRLMIEGHSVVAVDNFFTGRKSSIEHWIGHPNFQLINHDIVNPLFIEVDQIYHLASPASPPHYMYNPIKTIKTNTIGTINMLGLARRVKARLLFSSTSEVYGDPEVHPQPESYWGNVNPIGPRACYDESKRIGEAMCYAYAKQEHVQVRVARIFNTYGPRMNLNDGRVVSNFILQSLQGKNLTIYGDGQQTRSFQYVSDLVEGLIRLMNSNYTRPVNLGNPDEYTIYELANIIRDLIGNRNQIEIREKMEDDPRRRKPDITLAKEQLNWEPTISLNDGLRKTVEYFRKQLERINNFENGNEEDDDAKKKEDNGDLAYENSFYLSSSEEALLKETNYKIEL